jgi:hypothetical protein
MTSTAGVSISARFLTDYRDWEDKDTKGSRSLVSLWVVCRYFLVFFLPSFFLFLVFLAIGSSFRKECSPNGLESETDPYERSSPDLCGSSSPFSLRTSDCRAATSFRSVSTTCVSSSGSIDTCDPEEDGGR